MITHCTFNFSRLRRERGFSIIEVLIALLVLAIGLLGLAALQAQGLRFNHDAYVRTQATHIAYDIVDRMRANRANVADYTAADPGLPCDPVSVPADPNELARMDLSCWYDSLGDSLPAGAGLITANATANFYDVSVGWLDRTRRDFGGTLRTPASAAECNAIANRFWDGTNCLVTQTWTVWP